MVAVAPVPVGERVAKVTLNVLYLAHDLSDAAIRRRVLMLRQGGARVTVAGFQRADNRLADDPDLVTIRLGQTSDGRLSQRAVAVAKAAATLRTRLTGIAAPDVILARNLEMLVVAKRAARLFSSRPAVVYECLDIHRLLLDDGLKGRAFRRAEAYFGRNAQLLITSSPAFINHYFARRSGLALSTMLVENKVLELDDALPRARPRRTPPAPGEPWRIGWFGALRCRKSLAILIDFAARMQGGVEIVLRGRPARREFDDFDGQVEAALHVVYHGPYRNPEDLADIYAQVHFVWAIDFFEEGLNSQWLLPNRLYEGALHGAVPIALAATETGRFLDSLDIGLTLASATADALQRQFQDMDDDRYTQLVTQLFATERSRWTTGPQECRALVERLAATTTAMQAQRASPAASPVRS
ncbi:glycosyl transferase family 1 [Pseudorhizobium pelagicum]|uniref:glycosyl transferase family 1 n=1 Tax=Pseudorhizobium pelagicum TaxID=1509405 RepID=UPI000689AF02